MASIPQRVSDRFRETLPKFQKILASAHARDINEADTVTIVSDILDETFGFDKYLELTGEYAVRNTYCDLAVKLDGKLNTKERSAGNCCFFWPGTQDGKTMMYPAMETWC